MENIGSAIFNVFDWLKPPRSDSHGFMMNRHPSMKLRLSTSRASLSG